MVDWAYISGCPDDTNGDSELEIPGAGLDRLGVYTRGNKTEKRKLKKVRFDLICPKCGARLSLKSGKFGSFYGCSKFPECKGSMSIRDNRGMYPVTGSGPRCKRGV